jgi:hypothetical protein
VIAEPVLVSCLNRHWGLAGAQVGVHNGGMGSETWFVDLDDCRWVAKAVAPGDGRQFAGGLAVARRLEQAGIPVGAPVPARGGQFVVRAGDAWLALLTWVPGRRSPARTILSRTSSARRWPRCTGPEVERSLAPMLRPRWAVQADYFAWRIAGNNLTGISGPQENEKGLEDARLFLTS